MQIIPIIELASAIFVFIIFLGEFVGSIKTRSMFAVKILLGLTFLWLITDSLSYILNGPQTNRWVLYGLNLLSYIISPALLISYCYYCDAHIKEKAYISKWVFLVPMLVMSANFLIYILYFITNKLVVYNNGIYEVVGTIPIPAFIVHFAVLIYAPIVTFVLRKKVGIRTFLIVSSYTIPGIGAMIFLLLFGKDLSVVAGGASATIIATILQRETQKDKRQNIAIARNNERILALEDDFEALYDVDLFTLRYESYTKGQTFMEHINPKLTNSNNFFADTLNNVRTVVAPDDIPSFQRIMSPMFMRKALQESDHFDHFYRLVINGKHRWLRMRVVYKNAEKRNLIVGVFNAEEQMAAKEKEERFRRELVERMITDDALFIINLMFDTRKTIRNNTIDAKDYTDLDKFSVSMNRYIDNTVVESDRKLLREMTDLTYISERLKKETEFSFRYRETSLGSQRFFEMKFARFSEDEALMSVKEKDRAILEEMIFSSTQDDYFAMFAVDIEEGFARIIINNPHELEAKPGDVIPYAELMQTIGGLFDDDEAKKYFRKLSNTDYLKQKFALQNKSSFVFKPNGSNGVKWATTNEIVLKRNDDGRPSILAIGLSLLDRDASEKAILQERLRQNMQLISGLAEEYQALVYVNMDEETYEIYSLTDKWANTAKEFLNEKTTNLQGLLKKYGYSKEIHPEDKHLFAKLTFDNIRAKLAHTKKFSVRFRRMEGNEYAWFEMDIIKNEKIEERANSIAIGFFECGAEIRNEQAMQKSFAILGKGINPDEGINESLSIAADYYGSDRAYIFEINKIKKTISNTYEWCSEGCKSNMQNLQDIPENTIRGWLNEFNEKGPFYSEDINNPANTKEGIKILRKEGIESLIAAPITSGDEIIGFIGVDNPTKSIDDFSIIKTISIVAYSEILNRKQNDEEHITLEKVTDTFLSVYFVDLSKDYIHALKYNENYKELFNDIGTYSDTVAAYIKKFIPKEDQKYRLETTGAQNILKTFKTKDKFSVEMVEKNGDALVNVVFDLIKVSKDGSQLVICSRDVTDVIAKEKEQHKILQDALEAADTANKSKTSFLFNMSHDIRTPMNAIQGFTNMAIKYIDNKDKALDCLKKTQQSGNMLLSLINSVLEVSRIESGHATLDEQSFDVNDSFVGLESTMRELAEAKDIDLSFTISNIKNKNVICDYARCLRILVNVVSNAIKYTNNGGYVKVSCEQASDVENGMASYCYVVADNGIGMSEEFQKHVFEQFSREKTSTVSGIQGTGLGMAVCKSFVDLMGGTIDVKSKQGEGSTFTIVLPFKVQKGKVVTPEVVAAEEEALAAKKVNLKDKKALLVDDNALNREIAVEILTDEGIIPEVAFDGQMAVNMVKEKGAGYYDFVLMDIQMPIMDGYTATKEIRKAFPKAKLPIIALSANAFAEDKAASIEAGMNDHVAKPINVQELINCLTKFID